MKEIDYFDLYDSDLAKGCIIHTHPPFLKDYITLHILLKIADPSTVMEIGTHVGEGTNIICNALPDAKVYSLDLPMELRDLSLQHPSLKSMDVGVMCKLPYTQLLGDSMNFDYYKYPCEAYFVDGEHTEKNVLHETVQILNGKPKLIVYHDYDMPKAGMNGSC